MTPATPQEGRRLTRERLVGEALGLIQEEGLDGLSMRGLADRLDVKAASLYWHVRDRKELVDLLAGSILDSVPRRPSRAGAGWREAFTAIALAVGERVRAQNDGARILLEAPDALRQSDSFRDLKAQLVSAGLPAPEAADVARMAMVYVIGGRGPADAAVDVDASGPAELAVDSGSRGVVIRAGSPEMEALVRVPPGRSAAAPAVVRGEKVIVRRLRGVGRGELELNPRRPWRFHVQAPTWNTLLDLGGLDVQQIHVDSGAARLEVFLPRPAGVVPIQISGGVVGVRLHRPRGTAAIAALSSGVVQVRLDDFSTRATVSDTHWQTPDAALAPDRFEMRINGGAVRVELDEYDLKAPAHDTRAPEPEAPPGSGALEILLDGVEARVASHPRER